jgi:hypothetical protein
MEYASSSGPESIHTWDAVRQSAYTCKLKEDRKGTVGGSHEDLSVS